MLEYIVPYTNTIIIIINNYYNHQILYLEKNHIILKIFIYYTGYQLI